MSSRGCPTAKFYLLFSLLFVISPFSFLTIFNPERAVQLVRIHGRVHCKITCILCSLNSLMFFSLLKVIYFYPLYVYCSVSSAANLPDPSQCGVKQHGASP